MALGKKKIIIIAGVSAAVLVTALGVGLGVGLSSTTTVDEGEIYLDPISGETRSERDLLNNDITIDGKTFDVIKEGDKLFAVVAKDDRLEVTRPKFKNIHFDNGSSIIGEDSDLGPYIGHLPPVKSEDNFNKPDWETLKAVYLGSNYFYTIVFANIGQVKITNDGYIWGGFQFNENSNDMELNPVLTNGPLKFGEISANGIGLIDLAVVNEYQEGLKDYNDATSEADRSTAAERMRNADSDNGKQTRDNVKLSWQIVNLENKASFYWHLYPKSILEIPLHIETSGTENVVNSFPYDVGVWSDQENIVDLDENGKFDIDGLSCSTDNTKAFRMVHLVTDDAKILCIEPAIDANNKATVNQAVQIPLGNTNYRLFDFQGGHIKNPLLNKISTTSELTATPDGYVTLPGITNRVRVQEKTNYVVVPSDIKIELDKAMSS